eukprot:scaffold2219_cov177-Amphora_coffeaeformis.AAC.2
MDAGPCDYQNPNDICRILDQSLWQPLSETFRAEIWTRLDCERYTDLCHELSTAERVTSIRQAGRKVDFLTVAYSPTSPTSRLVELYRASQASAAELARYLERMIAQNLPFEASLSNDIDTEITRMKLATDAPKQNASLAVLVLTNRGFVRPDVWQAFAESSPPGEILIFMHSSSNRPHPSNPHEQHDNFVISVPSVFSHRGTIALVRPVLQLLRCAISCGGASHYVLVSGDSVPLVSAADMIRQLTREKEENLHPTTTRFERHTQDQFKVSPEFRKAYRGPFRKSKNWVLWNDEAARFFAAHDETHNFEIVSMADEYYWINVAQEHGIPWVDLPVMYDEWPVAQSERPNLLQRVNAAALRQQHGEYLFARKITNETILELDWMVEKTRHDYVESEL